MVVNMWQFENHQKSKISGKSRICSLFANPVISDEGKNSLRLDIIIAMCYCRFRCGPQPRASESDDWGGSQCGRSSQRQKPVSMHYHTHCPSIHTLSTWNTQRQYSSRSCTSACMQHLVAMCWQAFYRDLYFASAREGPLKWGKAINGEQMSHSIAQSMQFVSSHQIRLHRC